tara:strand:- start:1471 stop:2307 length:837 start_codon:yes stop_codon:yes gene_type:complete
MKSKNYNNIPDSLNKKLGRNETAVYRLINIKPDQDNPHRWIIPSARQIRPTDSAYCPENDNFYDIAYITRVTAQGKEEFGDIVFYATAGGTLRLNGKRKQDRELYQYLELSNYNTSNVNRVDTYEEIFYRLDKEADADEEIVDRRVVVDALNKALNMSDAEIKTTAGALGVSLSDPIKVIRNEVEAYAGENPDEFIKIASQQTNSLETTVREAVDLGIVQHDAKSGKFVWSKSKKTIYTYKKKIGVKPFAELAEYLLTEDKKERQALETRVEASRNNP